MSKQAIPRIRRRYGFASFVDEIKIMAMSAEDPTSDIKPEHMEISVKAVDAAGDLLGLLMSCTVLNTILVCCPIIVEECCTNSVQGDF